MSCTIDGIGQGKCQNSRNDSSKAGDFHAVTNGHHQFCIRKDWKGNWRN